MLLAALTSYLAGCKNGLSLDWHVVDGDLGFVSQRRISDQPLDMGHVLEPAKADGMTCLSADDQNRGMRRCKLGNGWAPALYCVWHAEESVFGCGDGSVRNLSELNNWACLSPIQWDQALSYCQRKKRG